MGSSADAIGGRKRHLREAALDAGDEAKESLETWRKGERKAAAGGAEVGERSEVAMGESSLELRESCAFLVGDLVREGWVWVGLFLEFERNCCGPCPTIFKLSVK